MSTPTTQSILRDAARIVTRRLRDNRLNQRSVFELSDGIGLRGRTIDAIDAVAEERDMRREDLADAVFQYADVEEAAVSFSAALDIRDGLA